MCFYFRRRAKAPTGRRTPNSSSELIQMMIRDNILRTLRLLVAAIVLTVLATITTAAGTHGPMQLREAHALWAHPPDVGKTAASTREFVMKCKRANIDTIVMDIKG